jgi:hypothetical protein
MGICLEELPLVFRAQDKLDPRRPIGWAFWDSGYDAADGQAALANQTNTDIRCLRPPTASTMAAPALVSEAG